MSRRIEGDGTPETAWRAWPPLAALPRLDPAGVRRALVVAPHPDDEVLGPGGTLAVLAAGGTAVAVLALTDGEASHPASDADRAELGGVGPARRRRPCAGCSGAGRRSTASACPTARWRGTRRP